jgi:hypothetical protein
MRLFKTKVVVTTNEQPKGISKIFRPKPSEEVVVTTSEEPKGISKIFRPKPSDEVPQGDRPPVRAKGEKVTSEELRTLRELMRQRYALDLEIWSLRKVGNHNKCIVEDKMKRADALLARIRALVLSMDNRNYFNTATEYQKLTEVKFRVLADGKREWMRNPPWDED